MESDSIMRTRNMRRKPKNPNPRKQPNAPFCGCPEYTLANANIFCLKTCDHCGKEYDPHIDYTQICNNCHNRAVNFKGHCLSCGWNQINTKEDLDKIEVHTQP